LDPAIWQPTKFQTPPGLSGNSRPTRFLYLPRFATIVTSNRCRIHVSFRFLVIPLLIRRLPDFFLTAIATLKSLIDVKLWQPPIRVDVVQFRLVSGKCGGVLSLNFFRQRRNALCLGQLFGSRIATRLSFNRHAIYGLTGLQRCFGQLSTKILVFAFLSLSTFNETRVSRNRQVPRKPPLFYQGGKNATLSPSSPEIHKADKYGA
jgi:hypothetical protein